MKIQALKLIVEQTIQPMGAMFPTRNSISIETIIIWIEKLDLLIRSYCQNVLLSSSVERDNRKTYKCTLIKGDELMST